MFTVEHCDSAVVISPTCDLDVHSRDAFLQCLEEIGTSTTGRVIVSFLHCNYVDSSALNALAVARRSLKGRLVLTVPSDVRISRVFTITDFHKVVDIYSTLEAALAA